MSYCTKLIVCVIQIAISLCFSSYLDGYLNFVYPKLNLKFSYSNCSKPVKHKRRCFEESSRSFSSIQRKYTMTYWCQAPERWWKKQTNIHKNIIKVHVSCTIFQDFRSHMMAFWYLKLIHFHLMETSSVACLHFCAKYTYEVCLTSYLGDYLLVS